MDDPDLRPARWYVMHGEVQTGPFGLADMRERVLAGDLAPDTWVWADGMPDWMAAGDVPALIPPDDGPAGR